MADLVYHKNIVRKHNILKSKRRYQAKRTERGSRTIVKDNTPKLSWIAQMKLRMAMNPKDYRDYLEKTTKKYKTKHKDYPDLDIEFSKSGDTVTISGPAKNKDVVLEKKQSLFDRFLSKLTKK